MFARNSSEASFMAAVNHYATSNLASVKIAYRTPYVQAIQADLEMSFTTFVGNTGGMLGLFMGFSLVTIVEVFYLFLVDK